LEEKDSKKEVQSQDPALVGTLIVGFRIPSVEGSVAGRHSVFRRSSDFSFSSVGQAEKAAREATDRAIGENAMRKKA
jgi:hypothetical protein